MNTIRTISDLRAALAEPRRAGRAIGLVPTMGAFHEGHLSLMRRARAECDVVVVSLFVNPTQFDESGDLAAYPSDERCDAELAAEAGVDILFAPSADEVYPPGFSTTVSVAGSLSTSLEGSSRGRGHFDGVVTVVTKLLNIVGPQVAYFGQKDAQQALLIQRLVRDLDMPVRIEVCETVREPDGVAMSSRNTHLDERARRRASALHRALQAAAQAIARGERDPSKVIAGARTELTANGIEPDYFELVGTETLAPLQRIDGEPVLALIAARVGETRLIDNLIIETHGRP